MVAVAVDGDAAGDEPTDADLCRRLPRNDELKRRKVDTNVDVLLVLTVAVDVVATSMTTAAAAAAEGEVGDGDCADVSVD